MQGYLHSRVILMMACLLLLGGGTLSPARAADAGASPVRLAADGNLDALKRLLTESPARVNETDAEGNTALHAVAKAGRADAIWLLARLKADPRLRNKAGQTAHDIATARGDAACAAALAEAELWWTNPPVPRTPAFPSGGPVIAPIVSPEVHGGDLALPARIDVRGWKDLYLIVDDDGDRASDWADWGEARLIASDGSVIYLDALEPDLAIQGWGRLHRDGRNLTDGPLQCGTQPFTRGLGTHAPSLLHYVLPKLCERFEALVGVDTCQGKAGGIRFIVSPDFAVQDIDGRPITFSAMRGKVVVLFFFSPMTWNKGFEYTWLKYGQELHQSQAAQRGDLVVLALTPDNKEVLTTFLREQRFTFRVVRDPLDTVRTRLGLVGLPAVILDREGAVFWQRRLWQRNKIEDSGLFLAVDRALAAGPGATAPSAERAGTESRPPEVVDDFEHGYARWALSGDCWGPAPATDGLYPGLVKGYAGRSYVNTMGQRGPELTGMAVSAPFTIERPYLHFLIGGGDLPDHCCLALVVDGCAVRRATGENSAELKPVCWDLRDLRGKQARLEILDAGKDETRDFLLLDQIVFADSPGTPGPLKSVHDPDDPVCAARVAGAWPSAYRAVAAGQFHIEATPGRTYRMDFDFPLRWNEGRPAEWMEYSHPIPPTDISQTVRSAAMTADAGGRHYEAQVCTTGRPVTTHAWALRIPADQLKECRAQVHVTCDVTINNLKFVDGRPEAPPQDLPSEERLTLTGASNGYPFDHPWVRRCMDEHKLWRWPGETDAGYLLRAYRFFQRYFSYTNVAWGGHSSNLPWTVTNFESLAADCGLARHLCLLLRANGIAACTGQGGWADAHGGKLGPHVRALVFLREVGWLWLDVGPEVTWAGGQFAPTARWGDDFLVPDLDDSSRPSVYPPAPGSGPVLRGWPEPTDWWHSRVVQSPGFVLAPTGEGEVEPTLWRYTLSLPAADWAQPDADDSAWAQSPAPFGTPNTGGRTEHTAWTTRDIWLRREFALAPGPLTSPRLRIFHDEDCEVYLNGRLAAALAGAQGYQLYPLSAEAIQTLQPGRNVLAVHCRNTAGPGSIDVGLVDLRLGLQINTPALLVRATAERTILAPGETVRLRLEDRDPEVGHHWRVVWSDNGAGGRFIPSADVAEPQWAAPATTAAPTPYQLTAVVTCDDPALSARSDCMIHKANQSAVGEFLSVPRHQTTANTVELQDLAVVETDKRSPRVYDAVDWDGGRCTGSSVLFCPGEDGGHVVFLLPRKSPGRYDFRVYAVASTDYGAIRFYLDGKQVGPWYDCWNTYPAPTGPIALGTHYLGLGEHRLGVEVVGKNRYSDYWHFGLDCLTMTPK